MFVVLSSQLAACDCVHLIASCSNVGYQLNMDPTSYRNFSWIYQHVSTFRPLPPSTPLTNPSHLPFLASATSLTLLKGKKKSHLPSTNDSSSITTHSRGDKAKSLELVYKALTPKHKDILSLLFQNPEHQNPSSSSSSSEQYLSNQQSSSSSSSSNLTPIPVTTSNLFSSCKSRVIVSQISQFEQLLNELMVLKQCLILDLDLFEIFFIF